MGGDTINGREPPASVEARVFEIGEAYLDQLQAAETSSAASLIARQPELAPYLERHLALVEVLFRSRIAQDGDPVP